MITPLPESLRIQQRPDPANTGLWYDKFCNQWCRGPNRWSLKSFIEKTGNDRDEINPKLEWIKTVTEKTCGDKELLEEYTGRILTLAKQRNGSTCIFSTSYRFVSGMGRNHPVENGFAWHHTLGVPYLAGSSVKGMLRSYLDVWTDTDKTEIKCIFGPRGWKNEQGQWQDTDLAVGMVIFLDVIPIAPIRLKADVMTPHFMPYYQEGKTPGDWHSPVPIPFLTVDRDTEFLFTVLPRTGSEQDLRACSKVLDWLVDALQFTGAGAKTAVGYGRFKQVVQQVPDQMESHPLLNEIEHAKAGELAQVAKKIEQLSDPEIKQQAVQKLWEKIAGKDFRKIRKKAEEKPDHWLNKIIPFSGKP